MRTDESMPSRTDGTGPEGADLEGGRRITRWREALAAGSAAAPETCLDSERIWSLARGDADAPELQAFVEHATRCSACTEAWRTARRGVVATNEFSTGAADRRPRVLPFLSSGKRLAATLAAIAATLVLVFGILRQEPRGPGDGVERTAEQVQIESAVDGQTLPRDAFELRWQAPGEGLRFRIWVTLEDTTPVDRARDLDEPRYLVPPERLVDVPAGASILWRVETTLGNGSELKSPTFINTLQ